MKVAVIPARGGSKRIPRKNVRQFSGMPMIAHSIECAKASRLFDRIIVSTDDDEIALVSGKYGAEVPFRRSPELSDDNTGIIDVIADATRRVAAEGATMSAVCCILATAPFLSAADLREGWRTMEDGDWSYVFAATTFAYPIFRSFESMPAGGVKMFFPEHFTTRSQDLPEALHDAGQFYWGRPDAWLAKERIFSERSATVVIPRWRVQDIDSEEDWTRAELMGRVLRDAVISTRGTH